MSDILSKIYFYNNKMLDISKTIDSNISSLIKCSDENIIIFKRGIFSDVKVLIEIFYKILYLSSCEKIKNYEFEYDLLKDAKKFVGKLGIFSKLRKIFDSFQSYLSHDYINDYGIKIIYYKYLNYLIYLKEIVLEKINIEIIKKIDLLISFNWNKMDYNYYSSIYKEITSTENNEYFNFKQKYIALKSIPRVCEGVIFYEITLSLNSKSHSKNNRITIFSKNDIKTKYPIEIFSKESTIEFNKLKIPIILVYDYLISIPLLSINSLLKMFGKYNNTSLECCKNYKKLIDFINKEKINLIDLIDNEILFNKLKKDLEKWNFFELLSEIKLMSINKKSGVNILRYLLYIMDNNVISEQLWDKKNCYLSDLYIKNKSIPFDNMPIASSLYKHNPSIYDLIECIDISNREHEFFNRAILKKCQESNSIYVNKSCLTMFENHDLLIKKFNSNLLQNNSNQKGRQIGVYDNFYFINSMEHELIEIIYKIKKLELEKGIKIPDSIDNIIKNLDCDEKRNVLKCLFNNTNISIICGSPGTGKTKLIDYISKLFLNEKKIFLSNTNSSIENLRRKITTKNSEFCTIKKFLNSNENYCDLLIVDECSVVSNKNILNILNRNFKFIVLVGDKNQIGSIEFGNWFFLINSIVHEKSFFELTKIYRSNDSSLTKLWDKVKHISEDLLEYIVSHKYHSNIDYNSFFEYKNEDKIILCFNYDGLYGINNINKLFQLNNKNNIFKIGDPIIFVENNSDTLHNNLKGIIKNIEGNEKWNIFDILIDKKIYNYNLQNMKIKSNQEKNSNSIIHW